jgi:hypothetical protein
VLNVPAPDGTRNAGRISSKSGVASVQFFAGSLGPSNVGDWIIAGVWVRAATPNGYFGSVAPVQVNCQFATLAGPGQAGINGGYAILPAPWKGDGEWEWVWGAWRINSSPRRGLLKFSGYADPKTMTDFFAPVLLDVSAGTISANEAWELALDLQAYRDDAAPGQVSLLRGEQFKADSIQVGDGPSITSGVGPPKGSASPGSIYLRRDGAAGSTFYIYEGGEWKGKL